MPGQIGIDIGDGCACGCVARYSRDPRTNFYGDALATRTLLKNSSLAERRTWIRAFMNASKVPDPKKVAFFLFARAGVERR